MSVFFPVHENLPVVMVQSLGRSFNGAKIGFVASNTPRYPVQDIAILRTLGSFAIIVVMRLASDIMKGAKSGALKALLSFMQNMISNLQK